MIGLVKSEWIKLSSTKSAYWLYALAILLPTVLAILLGMLANSASHSEGAQDTTELFARPTFALMGAEWFTFTLVWIAAIVAVTGEYRYHTIRTTFLATPKRWPALGAKTIVYAVATAVVTFLAVLLALGLSSALTSHEAWGPFTDAGSTLLWRYPVYALFGAVLSIGLALIMRNAAGAIATLLVWVVVVEPVVGAIPKVGEKIQEWMPFAHGQAWMKEGTAMGVSSDWDPAMSLLWFAAVCVVVFVVGVVLTLRRDA